MFEFEIDFEALEVLSTSLERSKWFPSCLFLALRLQFDRLPSFPTNIPCQIQHASRCPDDRLDWTCKTHQQAEAMIDICFMRGYNTI